ncbi:MAG: hypothetical protein ACOY9Y_02310 [Bacillota bacterium]
MELKTISIFVAGMIIGAIACGITLVHLLEKHLLGRRSDRCLK